MIKLFYFILGQYVGSFLHVIAYRAPKGIYFSTNYSFCHNCYKNLKWYELIPVFSYLLQRGKCRKCKCKISSLHLFGELICGVLFLMCYLKFGHSINFIYSLIFISLLFLLSITDIYYYILPNLVLILFTLLIILWQIQLPYLTIQDSIRSTIFSLLLIGLLILVTHGGMGMGDFKLLAILAYFFGFYSYLQLLLLASLLALLYFSYLNFQKKDSTVLENQQMIYFGPFIAIAAVIVLFLN